MTYDTVTMKYLLKIRFDGKTNYLYILHTLDENITDWLQVRKGDSVIILFLNVF